MTRELVKNVQAWFEERQILENSTPVKQMNKLAEELLELNTACAKNCYEYNDADIIDAIGDMQVVLIGICKMYNLDFDGCLNRAYEEISKRTGKMINGVFVKD